MADIIKFPEKPQPAEEIDFFHWMAKRIQERLGITSPFYPDLFVDERIYNDIVNPEPGAPLRPTSIALSEEDSAWLMVRAEDQGISRSEFVRRLIARARKEEEPGDPAA